MNQVEVRNLLVFSLLVFISRLPFLFHGYGSEEDAWALPLVAERIGTTGSYEVSRLPGHPFQELIYSTCWQYGSVFFNIITMVISTAGILSFTVILKQLNITTYYTGGAALAFTPVVYINSCNAMDYTWAMAFILIGGYLLLKRNPVLAGSVLAFATGCRITSGAMIIPYILIIIYLSGRDELIKNLFKFIGTFTFCTLLLFLPVYIQYGTGFFTYYEHFPLPGILKNIYKGTIAVWGLPSFLLMLYYALRLLKRKNQIPQIQHEGRVISRPILLVCTWSVILFTIAFIMVPLKAAFMIPAVPFVILIAVVLLKPNQFRFLTYSLLFSCFFFGINLADAHRGSKPGQFAITYRVDEQMVSLDPLCGLVLADHNKKKQRTEYVKSILHQTELMREKTVVIAGWWLSEILVRERETAHAQIHYMYYIDEPELIWYQKNDYQIYYLEEQDRYNDLRFRKIFTNRYANALPQ